MKTTLFFIVIAALAAGWWQGRELSLLTERETELRVASGKSAMAQEVAATKPTRRDAMPALDGATFVELLAKPMEKGKPPAEKEQQFLRERIATASGRELKQWAVALRESELSERLKRDVLVALAPRLAESDPKLAAELVLDGGEGTPFRSVLRTWLATDAKAAAAWLAAVEPPLEASRFRNLEDLDVPGLMIAADVIAYPGDAEALMTANAKSALAAFGELAAIQPASDLANVLKRFSRESRLPEDQRARVMGGTLSRHRDPAVARQILLDASLPLRQLSRTALIMIQALDPVGRQSAIEWANGLPDAELRAELVRAASEATQ